MAKRLLVCKLCEMLLVRLADLDGRRVIAIDLKKKTYGVATFDQIKAAMEQAQQRMQQQMQQNPQQAAAADAGRADQNHAHHPRDAWHWQPRDLEPADK